LSFPSRSSDPRGDSTVQIQRMVHADRYRHGHPSPNGVAYDIAGGEQSILAQYLEAIDAARRSIYIENQAIPIPQVSARLEQALKRGVDIVALVPADPEEGVRAARRNPQRKPLFDGVAALGRYENFMLAGIAAPDAKGSRRNIYVHSKIMLVDDAFATIGSCNLHAHSLSGHTEMNASIWDPKVARALRCELLTEHLGQDTAGIDDGSALRLFREIASANRRKRDANYFNWQVWHTASTPSCTARNNAAHSLDDDRPGHSRFAMTGNQAGILELTGLGESPNDFAGLLRGELSSVRLSMHHVGILLHGFGVLEILGGIGQNEFVIQLAVVPQHKLDLLTLPDLKPRWGEQHFSVRLAHRHLDGS
jgi:hypothetical protein